MERLEVYQAIDSERKYQDQKWNEQTTTSKNIHSLEEWIMYVEDYLNEAKHTLSRMARQDADPLVKNTIRKATAMLVCCMEQHGVKNRQ